MLRVEMGIGACVAFKSDFHSYDNDKTEMVLKLLTSIPRKFWRCF
jgi:hypothetical protein